MIKISSLNIKKLIGEGNTAEIYDIGEKKALKLFRKGFPKERAETEYYITRNVYNELKVCPKVYEIIDYKGRTGIVYEKIDGETFLKKLLKNILNINKTAKLMARYHISIQKEVSFKIPIIKDKLKCDIAKVKELSIEEKEKLYKYIDELPNKAVLCHIDFHPDNIMIKNNNVIIIDWMNACIGDPLADVARTVVMLKYGMINIDSKLLQKIIIKLKVKVLNIYLEEYLNLTGANIKEIERWQLPICAARLCEWISKEERDKLLQIVRDGI